MRLTTLLFVLVSISGCQKNEPVATVQPSLSDMIAKIDGEPVYKDELDIVINHTVGEFAALQLGDDGRKKVLESLIIRKLMSDKQLQSMGQEELRQLELEITSYREELLTKRYVREQLIAQPVTDEMIADYYQSNLHIYGENTVRRFEMARADVSYSPALQKKISLVMQELTPHSNWSETIKKARQIGQPLFVVSGSSSENGLTDDYKEIIQSLGAGDVSALYTINGIMVRFKITELIPIPAKPLSEVSADIRKTLAPLQLKKSIQQEAELLMLDREIERYAMD
jgi:hypothetical protein